MEKDLKRIKGQMLSDELSGFEFTEEMRRQVLNKIEKKHGRERRIFKPLIPITVTAAFLFISSAGIYHITTMQDQLNQQSEGPPAQPEEEKPALVFPGYVPKGYEFKHTKTNDEVYEHVYVKGNAEDYFSYRMQKRPQLFQQDKVKNIPLSPNLQGTTFTFASGQSLQWENDGYFHILEQKGDMEEIDFLKIADSILAKQGIQSYLGDEIEKLEAEAQDQEKTDVPVLTEEKAIEILRRYEGINGQVYYGSPDGKIEGFKTKDQFYKAFSEVMTKEAAEETYSYRITEKEDGLYLVPMGGIPSWIFNVPNKLEKINDKKYTITQSRADYGQVDYSITLEWINGKWLINDLGKFINSSS